MARYLILDESNCEQPLAYSDDYFEGNPTIYESIDNAKAELQKIFDDCLKNGMVFTDDDGEGWHDLVWNESQASFDYKFGESIEGAIGIYEIKKIKEVIDGSSSEE